VGYTVASRYVHLRLAQTAAVPARARGRRLLVFLHGRGPAGDRSNANPVFARALAALGDRAAIVVFPDGGVSSDWHARGSGDWGRSVLPVLLARRPTVMETCRTTTTRPSGTAAQTSNVWWTAA
jgi:hypothetical protein